MLYFVASRKVFKQNRFKVVNHLTQFVPDMLYDKNIEVTDLCGLMIDASIDRILAIDTEWRIITWNLTSEVISGVPKEQVMGMHLLKAFPAMAQDNELVAAIKSAMHGKKSFLPANPGLGHRRFYENHYTPLFDKTGDLLGVMNIMHDVSHRLKAEHALQNSNDALSLKYSQLEKAAAELAIFTSVTGKDLKEPVKKIYTGLEMLVQTDGQKLSDNSRAGLRRMQASLTKINLLLDDILKFSAASSFDEKFQALQLDDILKGAVRDLQPKIDAKNAVIHATSLTAYFGSREMLHYLFVNIIDNALKFQPEANTPVINISFHTDNPSYYCIAFTDNGIGFDQQDSKRIFNMFERLHTRKQFAGAGIGLAICQKIAETHGGYIEAESAGNAGGATFRCYLRATKIAG